MKYFVFASLFWMSCSTTGYYTVNDFQSIPKVDVHVHIRTERDAFAEQARADNFKLVNIVVDGAGTWLGVRDQFHYVKIQQEKHPDLYRTITAFSVEDFFAPGWTDRCKSWMDSCFTAGAIGIKVWKNIGMVLQDSSGMNIMLDDPRFDPLFNHVIERQKLVVGHLGEPLNCWLPLEKMTTHNDRNYFSEHPEYHMYQHPQLPSYQDQISARNRRLDKHPGLSFMGAHMASIEWNVDSLAAWFDRYPGATIDLAARMGQVFYQTRENHEKVRQFFIKYQNRIMYATDLGDNGKSEEVGLKNRIHDTWLRDWTYFATDAELESDLIDGKFKGLQLPKESVDLIFYKNAYAFFGF